MPIATALSSTPSALKRYSNLLRMKLGAEVAQALISMSDDVIALHAFVDTISLFEADQIGGLSVEQLQIRNVTSRFHFEDPADTLYIGAATFRIPLLGEWQRISNTTGGALVLASVPSIAAGKNGQLLELTGISAQTTALQDAGTLAGSGVRLGAAARVIGNGDTLALRFSTDLAAWCERFYSNVL